MKQIFSKWYAKLILPILLLVVWFVAAKCINNEFILPEVWNTLKYFTTPFEDLYGSGNLLENASVSIERVSIGFLIGAAIAVPLGIVLGRYPTLENLADGLIQILRPIPPIAWIPLALAWFKMGLTSIVFVIIIGCIFPILVSTIDGVKRVKKSWVETAKIYQANDFQILTKVILPAASPTICSGLRVGFGIAWMSVVAAEMLPGATNGLGYLISYSYQNQGNSHIIIVGMITIGLIGFVMDQFFKYIQKRKLGWEVFDK
ncbi:MAG TPA: ABC transporter permease [Methanocorpusculum sp.]|nr:ABC transporter permease [Methanocorpusculum sp.]